MKRNLPALISMLTFLCFSQSCAVTRPSLVVDAEQFRSEKKYPEAIAAYTQHLQNRLESADRPDWENPYFYDLLIGDIQLEKGDLVAAKSAYLEALEHNVEEPLFLDRMRQLAKKYEQETLRIVWL